jgi:histone deacetylase complex regulatory component SIN3
MIKNDNVLFNLEWISREKVLTCIETNRLSTSIVNLMLKEKYGYNRYVLLFALQYYFYN